MSDDEIDEVGVDALTTIVEPIPAVWKDYITHMCNQSREIERAMICSNVNGAVWARTEKRRLFEATEAELAKLAEQMEDTSQIPQVGVDLEELHYVVTRVEENFMFGKSMNYRRQTGRAICAMRTSRTIIIVIYRSTFDIDGDIREIVSKLAQHFEQNAF